MNWTRHKGKASHHLIKPGELIPLPDRILWMLEVRVILAVAVMVVWLLGGAPHGSYSTWIAWLLAWPAVTALALFTPRFGRRYTRAALTASLFGDGLLLNTAGWALGQLHGIVGFLIILHAVAVTLLASFRTGVRIAVWHCLVTGLFFNAIALGLLDDTAPGTWGTTASWLYAGALWVAVVCTAAFASMNERELRRRRYDSDMLRQFGLAASTAQDTKAIIVALADFAVRELPARRAVVLAYVQGPEETDDGTGIGVLMDQNGTTHFGHLGSGTEPSPESAVRRSLASGSLLLRRLDVRTDGWLAELLPGARNVVVVPFAIDKVIGALVVEVRVRRLERRLIENAMQAVLQASVALDRVVLTDHIRMVSETDGLTRVANRRRFDQAMHDALRHAAVNGTELAIAIIDIDHFKRFNDTYGHQVGDDVLRLVAAAIKEAAGEGHLPARYGGEEFAIIMPGADGPAALATAERIRLRIGAASMVTPITASLGVASCPAHGNDAATLIAAADAALYRSKDHGRNQTTFADPQMETVSAAKHEPAASQVAR